MPSRANTDFNFGSRFRLNDLLLLRFHGPMLWITCRIIARAVFPKRTRAIPPIQPVTRIIPAPPEQLVKRYLDCCGAADKYPHTLPPHMVAQWGLPVAARLLLQTPFNLSKVLNQGVTMRINGALPRKQPLCCIGQIQSISEESHRTRVSVLLQTGTAEQPALVELVLHLVFIHGPAPARNKSTNSATSTQWEAKGSWSAAEQDGLLFALTTGDFNPIHWLTLAGKLSGLNQKILQGFASFARSYEQLAAGRVRQIDLRFLRPVPLPSAQLQLEQSIKSMRQSDGEVQLRLRGPDEQLHLAGSVSYW